MHPQNGYHELTLYQLLGREYLGTFEALKMTLFRKVVPLIQLKRELFCFVYILFGEREILFNGFGHN